MSYQTIFNILSLIKFNVIPPHPAVHKQSYEVFVRTTQNPSCKQGFFVHGLVSLFDV